MRAQLATHLDLKQGPFVAGPHQFKIREYTPERICIVISITKLKIYCNDYATHFRSSYKSIIVFLMIKP